MLNRTQQLCARLSNSTIDAFDIFGQLPNFRILEKAKYTTPVGCLVTFLIGIATLLYLSSEFFNLLSKSEPNVVSAEVQIFDSTSFPLYNENFTLAITIANQHSEPILGQLKYYNITVNHCIRERKINEVSGKVAVTLNCSSLLIAPCTRDDFSTDLQKDFFKNTRLGVVQCINREAQRRNPPVQIENIQVLQGIISGYRYQYLVIKVDICKNNTEYQGCAPRDDILRSLSSGYYSVYASDYLMQLDRGNIPYQEFINLDINSFSIQTSMLLQWTYRIAEVHTDDGLFFSSDAASFNLKKQDSKGQTELYNGDYLVYHLIQLDYKEQIYKRSYIKVQVILSKIGGIWQLFTFLATAILNPLISNLMTISIANELYRFPKSNPNNRQAIQAFDLQQSDSVIDFQLQKQKQNSEQEEHLSYGLVSSLMIIFGCNKRKKKIFTQVKSQILQQIDIVKIIEKLEEIDMLKHVIFDDEQYQLFDLIPKPVIKEENNLIDASNNNDILSDNLRNSFRVRSNSKLKSNRLNQYIHSFSQVSRFKSRSSVDDKLLNLIDKKIVKFFEEYQLSQPRGNNLTPLDQFDNMKIDQSIYEPSIQRPK